MLVVPTHMNFEHSAKVKDLLARLTAFMTAQVYPNERRFHDEIDDGDRWQPLPLVEELKARARAEGLWNLFLPESGYGAGLTNSEYAPLCEVMGRASPFGPEIFNCSAPDTGNMEVLVRYGTAEQRRQWLDPLLAGEIRSCFAMTEPDVASSDATNIQSTIARDGDEYVINGRKWWISGAGDPRCRIAIFMGRSNAAAPRHQQQSMILVPMDTPGVRIRRTLSVFGFDDAPHGHAEIVFENVRGPGCATPGWAGVTRAPAAGSPSTSRKAFTSRGMPSSRTVTSSWRRSRIGRPRLSRTTMSSSTAVVPVRNTGDGGPCAC
jgi:acyl-CoA dehydrogenase